MSNAEHPSIDALRHLSTLKDLSETQLARLSDRLTLRHAKKKTPLIGLGSSHSATLYLIDGAIQLVAADGGTKTIRHTDKTARDPIARLRPSRYEVSALSKVSYIEISDEIVQDFDEVVFESAHGLDAYEVDDDDLSEMNTENQITFRLFEDLNENKLMLPSLPDIAIRVGQAVSAENSDARKVAMMIETDLAMTAKLIKASNSAFYGSHTPVNTLPEAVVRLGMDTTHKLVMSFALRELFRSSSTILVGRLNALWDHSRQIAAICHLLAKRTSHLFNPDLALLAGLIHDVGVLVIINYSKDFPECIENPDLLNEAITKMRGHVGSKVLASWDFSKELIAVAEEAENWTRETKMGPDYADLVVAAQVISHKEGDVANAIPPFDEIPALSKLGLLDEAGDLDYGLLEEAADEIDDAESMLEG